MNLKLQGKTAFITGSTSGIGWATARPLAQEGVHVILNGRGAVGVSTTVEKLRKEFNEVEVKGVTADFLYPDQIKALLGQLSEVDIFINNVGIYSSASFAKTSDEDWYRQIEVNLMSGVRLSKYVLPKMLHRDWGRILFISSECATLVPEDLIAYSTTKAALLSLSRGISQLTSGSGVTVNTIVPGSTLTKGAEEFLVTVAAKENKTKAAVSKAFFNDARKSSLLQRFAEVKEIADTITYFSSPLSSATNGAVIKVDGGSMGGIL